MNSNTTSRCIDIKAWAEGRSGCWVRVYRHKRGGDLVAHYYHPSRYSRARLAGLVADYRQQIDMHPALVGEAVGWSARTAEWLGPRPGAQEAE